MICRVLGRFANSATICVIHITYDNLAKRGKSRHMCSFIRSQNVVCTGFSDYSVRWSLGGRTFKRLPPLKATHDKCTLFVSFLSYCHQVFTYRNSLAFYDKVFMPESLKQLNRCLVKRITVSVLKHEFYRIHDLP